MAELTREQKKALALAKARQRAAETQSGASEQSQKSFFGHLRESATEAVKSAIPLYSAVEGAAKNPDAVRQVSEGMAFGYGDEGAAAIEAALGDPKSGKFFDYSRPFGERYQSGVEQEQAAREGFAERNPKTATALEIGGTLGTAGGLGRAGLTVMGKGGTTAGRAGLAGVEGGTYGGLYGSGKADPGNRVAGALMGAGTGAAAGGALSLGGQAVSKALAKGAGKRAAPSLEALKRKADEAYDAARTRNPQFSGFDEFASQTRGTLDEAGFHPRLHPKLRVVLDEIDKLGPNPDFKTVEKARRMAKGAAGNFNNPDEQRLGNMLVRNLDEFVESASPVPEVKTGRQLYGQFKRGQMVDEALESAVRRAESTGSGGNVENAMRQNIRRILDSQKKRAGFSKPEIEAMEEFVRGGNVQNFLRLAGKFAPSGSGLTAQLSGFGGASAAGMTGNPLFMAPMAGGQIAKMLADSGIRRQASGLSALTRSGGQMPQVPAYLQAQGGQDAVIRALSGYAGGQAGARAPMPRR